VLAPEPERDVRPRDDDSGDRPRDDDSGDDSGEKTARDDDSGEDGADDNPGFDLENIRSNDLGTDSFSSVGVSISPVDKVRGMNVVVELLLVRFSSVGVNISPVDKVRGMDVRVDLVCASERP